MLAATSAWAEILGPFLGTFVALVALGAAYWPIYKKHQEEAERRHTRMDATADAVLGSPIDTNKGIETFQPGLIHLLPLGNHQLLGVPTVMDAVRDANRSSQEAKAASERSEVGQEALTESVNQAMVNHERRDDERFADLNQRFGKQQGIA